MHPCVRALLVVSAVVLSCTARAAVTIDYVSSSVSTRPGQAASEASVRFRCSIDGAVFTVTKRGATESSDDDGATTRFGNDPGKTNTPLVEEDHGPFDGPIVGWVKDDHLMVGPSTPGPSMFGLPTRTYSIDHDFTIGGSVLLIPLRGQHSHAHYTLTVIDDGTSAAAVRVAISRGHPHVLALHPEAFTGLPLRIDGTIESSGDYVSTFHIEAESFSPQPLGR